MTVAERIADISQKSGMSEHIVRRVLSASRDSITQTLTNGEKSTLPGIATFTTFKTNSGKSIRSKISTKILSKINEIPDPVPESLGDFEDVAEILQIPGLA